MKVQCAWCGKPMGTKEPIEDTSITHGICADCSRKVTAEIANKTGMDR